MLEIGTCAGIENYSRPLSGRRPGERPACLSTTSRRISSWWWTSRTSSLPQIGGMFNGDRARKLTLVEYGFRLPCALDNRPLMFDEFMSLVPQMITSRRRRAISSCACRAASSSSRSSVRPA